MSSTLSTYDLGDGLISFGNNEMPMGTLTFMDVNRVELDFVHKLNMP